MRWFCMCACTGASEQSCVLACACACAWMPCSWGLLQPSKAFGDCSAARPTSTTISGCVGGHPSLPEFRFYERMHALIRARFKYEHEVPHNVDIALPPIPNQSNGDVPSVFDWSPAILTRSIVFTLVSSAAVCVESTPTTVLRFLTTLGPF